MKLNLGQEQIHYISQLECKLSTHLFISPLRANTTTAKRSRVPPQNFFQTPNVCGMKNLCSYSYNRLESIFKVVILSGAYIPKCQHYISFLLTYIQSYLFVTFVVRGITPHNVASLIFNFYMQHFQPNFLYRFPTHQSEIYILTFLCIMPLLYRMT